LEGLRHLSSTRCNHPVDTDTNRSSDTVYDSIDKKEIPLLGFFQLQTPPNNACTGRLVGPAKKANPDKWLFPFRRLALPAAGNASR
jgi:hypothetical protein